MLNLLLLTLSVALPPELYISMVASTSLGESLPFSVYSGGNWKPDPAAKYVKVHSHFDQEVEISKIEVESCAGNFTHGVSVFLDFDENVTSIKGGAKILVQEYKTIAKAHSLTLNFDKNANVCVAAVRIYDKAGQPYQVRTPKVVAGTVTASDTLAPVDSYGAMNLFDSRYEHAWSSDKKPKGSTLTFAFAAPQTITGIKLWNGYQRSIPHCYSNSRAKTLTLTGEGYNETITVADEMGSQRVKLPKPFTGTKLVMTVADAYAGKAYKDLNISELRFENDDGAFMLDPSAGIKDIAARAKASFQKAALDGVLDHSLSGSIDSNTGDGDKSGDWIVRLRSDGTMFMEGSTTTYGDTKQKMQQFSALGNYEVKSVADGKMTVRVFGLVRVSTEVMEVSMDCNGCGHDCNKKNDPTNAEKIFDDTIVLEKKDAAFFATNTSKRKKLNFERLELSLE